MSKGPWIKALWVGWPRLEDLTYILLGNPNFSPGGALFGAKIVAP